MSSDKLPPGSTASSPLLGKRRHVYNDLRIRQGKGRGEESDGCSLERRRKHEGRDGRRLESGQENRSEHQRSGCGGCDDSDRIQEDKVAVELKDVRQPVDTTEYRGVEELVQQTCGEDKSP
ncbi:Uncharacterized protein Rs2_26274 [Raphanus sativus]|nr:Uncharacterized protein Rs2_26274 [Raphanus sativus]